MRRRIKAIIVVLAIIGLGVGAYYWYRTPPDPLAFLETAPQWTVYSLDPEYDTKESRPEPAFHGWKVLGQTTINRDQVPGLVAALRRGIQEAGKHPMNCFNPRLGIQAEHGGHRMEFVVCFECLSVAIYWDNTRIPGTLISNSPEPAFDKIFRDANIPLAPKD